MAMGRMGQTSPVIQWLMKILVDPSLRKRMSMLEGNKFFFLMYYVMSGKKEWNHKMNGIS